MRRKSQQCTDYENALYAFRSNINAHIETGVMASSHCIKDWVKRIDVIIKKYNKDDPGGVATRKK